MRLAETIHGARSYYEGTSTANTTMDLAAIEKYPPGICRVPVTWTYSEELQATLVFITDLRSAESLGWQRCTSGDGVDCASTRLDSVDQKANTPNGIPYRVTVAKNVVSQFILVRKLGAVRPC